MAVKRGGVGDGPVRQVSVAPNGLDQRVTEQLYDGHHVHAVHRGGGRPRVPEVMQPQSRQARLAPDAVPLVPEVDDVARRA